MNEFYPSPAAGPTPSSTHRSLSVSAEIPKKDSAVTASNQRQLAASSADIRPSMLTAETVYFMSLLDGIKEKLEFLSILKTTKEVNNSNVLYVFLKCEGRFDATLAGLKHESKVLRQLSTLMTPPGQEIPDLTSLSISTLNASSIEESKPSPAPIDPGMASFPLILAIANSKLFAAQLR